MRMYSTSNRQERLVILSGIALVGVYVPLTEIKAANAAFITENEKIG